MSCYVFYTCDKSMAESKRVYLVDDHPFIREGMIKVLQKDPAYCVCGEAGSVAEALADVPKLRPDFLIVDMSLEGSSGLEILEYIQKEELPIQTLVVSMLEEPAFIDRALQVGARGYIFKRESVNSILNALHVIEQGGLYMSQHVENILRHHAKKSTAPKPQELLSDREYEVFQYMGRGFLRKQIAEVMFVSPKTIDSHLERIKVKLNVKQTNHLIRLALQNSLSQE